MQCKEWGDANSELFKEPHDEAVHKNSYKSRLYDLISASLAQGHMPLCGQRPQAPTGIQPPPLQSKKSALFHGRLFHLSLYSPACFIILAISSKNLFFCL